MHLTSIIILRLGFDVKEDCMIYLNKLLENNGHTIDMKFKTVSFLLTLLNVSSSLTTYLAD
jgi:hypothetical protein